MDTRPAGTVSVEEVIRYLRRDHYLTKREAAEYLGWSVRKLEEYMPYVRHYRHGGRVYFKRSHLDAYMGRFEVAAAPDLASMAEEVTARLSG